MINLSGTSLVCGALLLPQQMCKRASSSRNAPQRVIDSLDRVPRAISSTRPRTFRVIEVAEIWGIDLQVESSVGDGFVFDMQSIRYGEEVLLFAGVVLVVEVVPHRNRR